VRLIKLQILAIIALLTAIVLVNYPIPTDQISTAFSDLMEVSGIISGILIAYMSAKVFQIRNERLERSEKIKDISDKLTAFRKILHRVVNSQDFWEAYSDIREFKNEYTEATYFDLHDFERESEAAEALWTGGNRWHSSSIDLFLSIEAIIDDDNEPIAWTFDAGYEPTYSLDQLRNYVEPSNQIWYYLYGRYRKHMQGMINDNEIHVMYQSDLSELVARIDPEYKEEEFTRHLLADIGADFHAVYLPKLLKLTRLNTRGVTQNTALLFINLSVIIIFGVLIPLLTQSTSFSRPIELALFIFCMSAVITNIIGLLVLLLQLINDELNIRSGT
jgi:hypothetical protein